MEPRFLFGDGCCGDLRLVDCHGPSHSAAGLIHWLWVSSQIFQSRSLSHVNHWDLATRWGKLGRRFNSNKSRLGLSLIEGSLEVKLPTIWTDEKQSREEAEKEKD